MPGGGGGGTPYDDQCTMLGGLDPHFRAWLDPIWHRVHFRAWLDPIGSIFELGSIPLGPFSSLARFLRPGLEIYGNYLLN